MLKTDYVLGHSQSEVRRLELQGEALKPGTERILRAAGLGPGMSVLDIGTGAGDVAMLAAALVGPSGSVLGIDREANVLRRARHRAEAAGFTGIRYMATSLDRLDQGELFDLVVGRYVLLHQADPAATLREAATRVRPGGILCFIEPALPEPESPQMATGHRWSDPPVPIYDETMNFLMVGFVLGGAHLAVGGHMVNLFHDAGLPEPTLLREDPTTGPSGTRVEGACLALRSLLPTLEKHGVTTAAEVRIETLEVRMRQAVEAAHSQLLGSNLVGAWARIG